MPAASKITIFNWYDPKMKNQKICIICGKPFFDPPSNKTVTCSPECRKEYARIRQTGRKYSEESRKKLSEVAKKHDISALQAKATEAAKKSPKSGRFQTNVNAIDWHLISPEGRHYYAHSLNFWLRENCRELFGVEPDSREFNNVRAGLSGAKRAAMGKKSYRCYTYKGWQVVPTENDF